MIKPVVKYFPEWWEKGLERVGTKYLKDGELYIYSGLMDDGEDYYYVLYPKKSGLRYTLFELCR